MSGRGNSEGRRNPICRQARHLLQSSAAPREQGVAYFMAHIIAQPCIGTKDASCVAVCPVDCIHPTKEEAEFASVEMLYIDPDACIDCGLCVDECPVTAIFPQEDLPAEWNKFIELNADYYKKK
jgi:NAD-dependent dihydropyrimidine dehydrogenase PreA subunit